MKLFLGTFLMLSSLSAWASESYECEFRGPNYLLTIENGKEITLKNNFKSYHCEKGFTHLPGTEVELTLLNCSNNSTSEKISFYFAVLSDDEIILSKNLVLSRDISCKKI